MAELQERRQRLVSWLKATPKRDPQRPIGIWRLRELEDAIRARGGRLGNPAWLDETLTVSWAQLEERLPPIVTLMKTGRVKAKPFGCGVWGCVMPTTHAGIVLKITNDPSEAKFVSMLLKDDEKQYPGLTRYYDLVRLPVRYQGRTVYAIWREEAWDVGEVIPEQITKGLAPRTRDERELDLFSDRLLNFQYFAEKFIGLKKRTPHAWRVVDQAHRRAQEAAKLVWIAEGEVLFRQARGDTALRMAIQLQVCRIYAELIAHGPRGQLVGRALADFMHDGLLLGDVHLGNIGHAHRAGMNVIVITDPGVTVALYQKLGLIMDKAA
jgi:hypothetical protein